MGVSSKEEELIAKGLTKFVAQTEEMYARYGLRPPKKFIKLSQRIERLKRECEEAE